MTSLLFFTTLAAILTKVKEACPLTPELCARVRRFCDMAVGDSTGRSTSTDDALPHTLSMSSEDLYDAVVDKMISDDYRILRQTNTTVPSNTWLRHVIRTTSIDLFRKQVGRPDWKKLGPHAKEVCRLVLTYGYPADEASGLLRHSKGIEVTEDEINRIVQDIQKSTRIRYHPGSMAEVHTLTDDETGAMVHDFIDTRPDPEEETLNRKRDGLRESVLKEFLGKLNDDDRFLIAGFFGMNGTELPLKEIARTLKSTETALQKRKRRILDDFRNWLDNRQITLEDVL